MPHAAERTRDLPREECLARVRSVSVGRLVFTERALPAVVPVNFLFEGSRILVPTAATSTLPSAVRGTVVAFQVDDVDPAKGCWWTVTVTGRATDVAHTDLDLDEPPLLPWAGERIDHVIVVPVDLVQGRCFGLAPVAGASGSPGGVPSVATSPAEAPSPEAPVCPAPCAGRPTDGDRP